MMKKIYIPFFALIILVFGAFGGAAFAAEQDATLRVVHTSPDASALDVHVNGNVMADTLEYKSATDYSLLASGENELMLVNSEGETVLEETIQLEAGKRYAVIVAGLMNELEMVLAEEEQVVAEGKSKIRVIQVSPNANIDLSVQGGQDLIGDAEFKTVGEYIEVNPNPLEIEASVLGITDLTIPDIDIQLEPNSVYSIYLVGLVEGAVGLETIVLLDNEVVETSAPEGANDEQPAQEPETSESPSSDEEVVIPTGMPQTGMGGTSSSDSSIWLWSLIPIILAGMALTFIYNRHHALNKPDYDE